jgi:hypothetical protein
VDKYLTTNEAAKIIKRNPDTLKVWRSQKKGPEFLKDGGGKIWYTEKALEDFIKGKGGQ